MRRRQFLHAVAGTGAALAAPSLARAAAQLVLKFVPEADLTVLDPIWTTAYVTRNHGYLVFDTLYGLDDQYRVQPQMLEGHVVAADGKEWRLTLRDGLRFHDGEPVLARDAVASIARWAKRDAFGATLMAAVDELSAASDKVIRFRLKQPFPRLPDALGKTGVNMPAIMPERLAKTDPFTRITEMVGSGPFRFKADEWRQGDLVVYERFADYLPRPTGTASMTAGPKHAYFDRVEWHIIPDSATSSAALQAGEVDWVDRLESDLTPVLRRDRNLTVRTLDPLGSIQLLRFNQLHPPFNNPAIRRALLGAVSQTEFMIAAGGNDRAMWNDHCGVFTPGGPMASDAGLAVLTGPRDFAAVKRNLQTAGYRGERVVFLGIANIPEYNAMGQVAADMFRHIGLNLDFQSLDFGTTVQRRSSMAPVEQGGWSVFQTGFSGIDMANPASALPLRGNGKHAWYGWPTAPKLESLRDEWFAAPDLATQRDVCRRMQLQSWQDVPFIPLGKLLTPVAYRADLKGVLSGLPLFWNVRRT